jgi:hypothetical protein
MVSRPQASRGGPGDGTTSGGSARPDLEPVLRRMVIDAVTVEVVEALDGAGIPSILLKGPALVRWLYPRGEGRSYLDSDILVPSEDVQRAERVLVSKGWERLGRETIPGDWPRHAHNWIRADGAALDLHFSLGGLRVAPEQVWTVLSERVEPMVVANRTVQVLDLQARALVVALHAYKDGGRIPQALRDLSLALEIVPRETWKEAAVLASRLDAVDAFAAGLERVPEGRILAAELGLPPHRSTPVALRVRGAPPLSVGMDWMFGTPGWRRKTVLVVRKIFPPRTFLRDWSPMARKGPLGLAAAYVWRPIWVLINAGPALRAWLRARRDSRRPPPDAS